MKLQGEATKCVTSVSGLAFECSGSVGSSSPSHHPAPSSGLQLLARLLRPSPSLIPGGFHSWMCHIQPPLSLWGTRCWWLVAEVDRWSGFLIPAVFSWKGDRETSPVPSYSRQDGEEGAFLSPRALGGGKITFPCCFTRSSTVAGLTRGSSSP